MSYNGSGTFNINSAGQPVVTGTVISSTAFNALTADLGTGLSTAITKDGQTVATARIPFAAGINSSLVTDATNTTTGSIITAGGVGIAKALFVGTTLNVAGASTLAAITGTFNGTVGATTPAAGSFTTLSASGVAALSRGVYRDIVGGGAMAIYDNSVVASGTNYVVASDGAATSINGTTTVKTRVSGTEVSSVSSTGLAVTGTLSATAGGKFGQTAVAVNGGDSDVRIGYIGAAAITSTVDLFVAYMGDTNSLNPSATNGSMLLYPRNTAGAEVVIAAGGAVRARVSSTGLAVTGTLSATGVVTFSNYGVGTATFNGSGVISSVSDETWKIKDGAPVNTDAMLNKLEPGYWYYNDEKKETFGKDRQLGFYAQNVNAAIGPEAAPEPETVVTKNDDGTETSVTKPWGYYDRSVLAVTVMSLQKALATIESLTSRITALEAK